MFWLKASRPGLWFQTLWLYLVPTSGRPELFQRWEFWLGLVYVTLPLNLLVYGWNDIVDEEIDRLNPRKDSFLFGARGSPEQLRTLPRLIVGLNLPFAALLVAVGGWRLALVMLGIVVTNAAYNWPEHGLRGRPPLELLNQLGYLLVLWLSSELNDVPALPTWSLVYLVLFCTHAHLMGEIMDVLPDRAAGRRTTATWLGVVPVKVVVIALVIAEACFLYWGFGERVLSAFLALGALWLTLDVAVLYRSRQYTASEFRLFGVALNVAGFASIVWVWWTGSLV